MLFGVAVAGSSPCFAADLSMVYPAEGYFEYTKDGASTLGLITSVVTKGKVRFTTCTNKTVEVVQRDLRPSKAKCDIRPPSDGLWQVKLDPVYKSNGDTSNTKVVFRGEVIDLKTIKGWSAAGISVRNSQSGEPVGFVFTDMSGSKAIAILKGEKPED